MVTKPFKEGLTSPDDEGEYVATLTRSLHFGRAYLEVHHRNAYHGSDPFAGRDRLAEMLERKVKQLADKGWKQVGQIKLHGSSAGVWIEEEKPVK